MTKKNDNEIEFSALFKDAKRVEHDKYVPSRQEKKLITKKIRAGVDDHAKQKASIELSDEFEAHWPLDKAIQYVNSTQDVDKDLIKKLKMGLIPPDIEVDLHGLTAKQAKYELLAVIFEAKKRHLPCISIIHGHGNGVLKHKTPNWLVQHPDVAAFVHAPKAYGGKAGLLVLVGIDFKVYKL